MRSVYSWSALWQQLWHHLGMVWAGWVKSCEVIGVPMYPRNCSSLSIQMYSCSTIRLEGLIILTPTLWRWFCAPFISDGIIKVWRGSSHDTSIRPRPRPSKTHIFRCEAKLQKVSPGNDANALVKPWWRSENHRRTINTLTFPACCEDMRHLPPAFKVEPGPLPRVLLMRKQQRRTAHGMGPNGT